MARSVLSMVFETEVTRKANNNGSSDFAMPLPIDVDQTSAYDSPWFWIPSTALAMISLVMGLALPPKVASGVKAAAEQVVIHPHKPGPLHEVAKIVPAALTLPPGK